MLTWRQPSGTANRGALPPARGVRGDRARASSGGGPAAGVVARCGAWLAARRRPVGWPGPCRSMAAGAPACAAARRRRAPAHFPRVSAAVHPRRRDGAPLLVGIAPQRHQGFALLCAESARALGRADAHSPARTRRCGHLTPPRAAHAAAPPQAGAAGAIPLFARGRRRVRWVRATLHAASRRATWRGAAPLATAVPRPGRARARHWRRIGVALKSPWQLPALPSALPHAPRRRRQART